MKKQYICPSFECTAVRYMSSLCSGSGGSNELNPDTQGGSQGGSRAPKF